MTAPPTTVSADADAEVAARALVERGVSYLPVVDADDRLAGVVTAGDLLAARRARRTPRASGPPLSRLATREVATVKPTDDLVDALACMSAAGIRHLPVVDGEGRIVGMLSDRDVRAAVGSPAVALDHAAARARVSALKVADAMARAPVTVGPDASFVDVARCLADHRVGAVPVVTAEGKVVGIVSYVDVLNAIAKE
jgi:acetoin utilization protein AcuB